MSETLAAEKALTSKPDTKAPQAEIVGRLAPLPRPLETGPGPNQGWLRLDNGKKIAWHFGR